MDILSTFDGPNFKRLWSMSSKSQWKIIHLLQKALEDNMTPTVNKCVKLKSKLQLNCFMFLKSVIYLGVSTTV